MIEILKAILLGIVQGFTEFLPVSSSGHLVFLQLLGLGEPSLFFNLMLHVGTLGAAVIALWKPTWEVFKSWDRMWKIILSCIPTVAIAAVFELFFEDLLLGKFLAFGFLITAVVLVLTEVLGKKNKGIEIDNKNAFWVGVMQGIAALPGVSRSGMTVGFLKGMGVEGEKAAQYSFIIGMPVILGGALVELIKWDGMGNWSVGAVIAGMIAAFLSGYVAVRLMLKLFAKKSLIPFAAYVTVLAILAFILV